MLEEQPLPLPIILPQRPLPIIDIARKQVIFFGRSEVTVQWLTVIVCLVIGWLLSKWMWNWLHQNFPRVTTFVQGNERLPLGKYFTAAKTGREEF